jgi:PIN domain nuclease of toxin-antitoxin system
MAILWVWWADAKRARLALGDRCCLALGLARKNDVVTAVRSWSKLKLAIGVEVLR